MRSSGKLGLVHHTQASMRFRRQGTDYHHGPKNLANSTGHHLKLVTRGMVRSSPRGPTTAPRVRGSR